MSRKLKTTKPVGPPQGWVVHDSYQLSAQVTYPKAMNAASRESRASTSSFATW